MASYVATIANGGHRYGLHLYKKAYDELIMFKSMVLNYKYKNEFDNLFINNVDKYLDEITETISNLEKSSYSYLRTLEDKISLCHNVFSFSTVRRVAPIRFSLFLWVGTYFSFSHFLYTL